MTIRQLLILTVNAKAEHYEIETHLDGNELMFQLLDLRDRYGSLTNLQYMNKALEDGIVTSFSPYHEEDIINLTI